MIWERQGETDKREKERTNSFSGININIRPHYGHSLSARVVRGEKKNSWIFFKGRDNTRWEDPQIERSELTQPNTRDWLTITILLIWSTSKEAFFSLERITSTGCLAGVLPGRTNSTEEISQPFHLVAFMQRIHLKSTAQVMPSSLPLSNWIALNCIMHYNPLYLSLLLSGTLFPFLQKV